MLERDDAGLYHDDLAAVNDPALFHQFAGRAGRDGLQYLGEAEPFFPRWPVVIKPTKASI